MSKWSVTFIISGLLIGCSPLTRPQMGTSQLSDPITAAAQVRQLEEDWVVAWGAQDYSFMERIMASEFKLASSGGAQGTTFNNREGWLKNARGMAKLPFEAKVIDVIVAGDTAVATLEARWRRESFLTDTWVKRNGRWQVIFRHSAPRRSDTAPTTLRP